MTATLAIDALAVARITRLVTADKITENARETVIEEIYKSHHAEGPRGPIEPGEWTKWVHEDPLAPKAAAGLVCPWCVSVWAAAAVYLARRFAPRLWDPLARILAASAVAGLASGHESA